jgi:hypothetical protein
MNDSSDEDNNFNPHTLSAQQAAQGGPALFLASPSQTQKKQMKFIMTPSRSTNITS